MSKFMGALHRKYRVGYTAPGIAPAFVCVEAKVFKGLKVGDPVDLRIVANGESYVDL
ncbi:MAG: hypothetical protein ABIV13_01890 [Fimbriimonadales bacterium]